MLFATISDHFRMKRHKRVIISSPRIFIANCLMVALSHDNLMMTNPTEMLRTDKKNPLFLSIVSALTKSEEGTGIKTNIETH